MVSLKMTGMKELISYFNDLDDEIALNLSQGNKQFIEAVASDARDMAPTDTGRLAESITTSKTISKGKHGQYKLEVGSPYGIFQEFGFAPHAFNPATAEGFQSTKLPADKSVFVSKWTPFIQPALTHNLARLDNQLNRALNRALNHN